MNCSNCGAPLPEGSAFCVMCGTPVAKEAPVAEEVVAEAPVAEAPVAEEAVETVVAEETAEAVADEAAEAPVAEATEEAPADEAAEQQEESNKSDNKKKKKFIAIIGAVAAIVLIGIIALVMVIANSKKPPKAAAYAIIDIDGNAYIGYGNGKLIEITGDIEDAILTPNGKRVVVQDAEGNIYLCNTKGDKKATIFEAEEDVKKGELNFVNDKFAFISVSEMMSGEESDEYSGASMKYSMIRYEFSSKSSVTVFEADEETEIDGYTAATPYGKDDVYFVLAEGGNIKLMRNKDDEFKTVCNYNDEAEMGLIGVSNNGKIIAWAELNEDGEIEIFVSIDGEKESVYKGDEDDFHMYSGLKGDTVILMGESQSIFVRKGKVQTVKFNGTDAELVGSTNGVDIEKDAKLSSADGYYVTVQDEESGYRSLYFVSFKDGEKNKIIPKCSSVEVGVDDFIVYSTTSGKVKCGFVDVKKGEIEDDERTIDSWPTFADASNDYLFYKKNGDLYIYNVKEDEDEKVEDVSSFYVCVDGKSVFYIDDDGTLFLYKVKKGKSVKVADDVIASSLTSNLASGELDSKSVFFQVLQDTEVEDGQTVKVIDLCYFNGSKMKVVKDGIEIAGSNY